LINQSFGNPNIEIVPQTSDLFISALELYNQRLDQAWSHTDCASFQIMHKLGIQEALAYDKHFEQAGFVALLRQD
jgi:predicted nucleic acid-binding protein